MRGKNKLVKWCFYPMDDLDGLKQYLEDMALKGWMLEKIGIARLTFGKYQPQRIIYSVEVFPKASSTDEGLTRKNHEFIEMCAAGGWRFLTSYGRIHIFSTIDENAVPIQTDLKIKLKMLNESMIKENVIVRLLLLFLISYNLSASLTRSYNYWSFSYGDPNVYLIRVCMFLTVAVFAALLIFHFLWFFQAKKSIEIDATIPSTGKEYMIISWAIWIVIAAFMIFASIATGDYHYVLILLICAGIIAGLVIIDEKIQKVIKTKSRPLYYSLGFILSMVFSIYIFSFQ